MRLLRPFLCAALVLAATLPAQQAAPLDAKTQQQYERLLRHRYTRDLTEVFAAMEKSAKVDARANADTRFLSAFRLGDAFACFGAGFELCATHSFPAHLPGGKLTAPHEEFRSSEE